MTTASEYRKPNSPVQPTCPQCSVPMELARKAPFKGHSGIQDLTYGCPKCGHSESWIASENNPKTERGHGIHN